MDWQSKLIQLSRASFRSFRSLIIRKVFFIHYINKIKTFNELCSDVTHCKGYYSLVSKHESIKSMTTHISSHDVWIQCAVQHIPEASQFKNRALSVLVFQEQGIVSLSISRICTLNKIRVTKIIQLALALINQSYQLALSDSKYKWFFFQAFKSRSALWRWMSLHRRTRHR